ncbi:hypothetical protein [Actinomadura formosensis]
MAGVLPVGVLAVGAVVGAVVVGVVGTVVMAWLLGVREWSGRRGRVRVAR